MADKLMPPEGGAIVRMYRIGHGDCFLLAFAGEQPEKPAYVLIDCGYKPGSPKKLASPTSAKAIGKDIIEATDGFVDLAIITHEHQDHVNGFKATNFPGLKVGKVWFAWTENPIDDVANELRKRFNDRLLGLIDARTNLLAAGESGGYLDWLLELELGEPADGFNGLNLAAGGRDPAKSVNKVAMKFLRDCAPGDPEYRYPHEKPLPIPGAANARAFVLGPPRDPERIDDLNPVGEEVFGDGHGLGVGAPGSPVGGGRPSPFPRRHVTPLQKALEEAECDGFFASYYGIGDTVESVDGQQSVQAAPWRRLGVGEAANADGLALAMNNATNNASLVLAFELSKNGKVLLFAGDAQAGNWRSWSDRPFDDGGTKVTTKDLLGRTVLYKVGHHGSHNATLNGSLDSQLANLAWMAQGQHAAEFTAMITAVEDWAHQKPKPDWNHPLPEIKNALLEKAGGRVLQTDTSLKAGGPKGVGAASWQAFLGRVVETPLSFDLTIDP